LSLRFGMCLRLDRFFAEPSPDKHPRGDGIKRPNHRREYSSFGAIRNRCMVTLANGQGGCDQDRKELSDAVESECLQEICAADTLSPWRSSKGTSSAGFRQMDPFRLSWHTLSLRKGMLPPLEHEACESPKGPKARRVLASSKWTHSGCPGTPCPYAEGCSHNSSMKGAKRRRAPRWLGQTWEGRGMPPAVLGEHPTRRLPSFRKSSIRPIQAQCQTRRAPESTRAAAPIQGPETRCWLHRASTLLTRGVADALRQGRCRVQRWRFPGRSHFP
jgi:hypothetical protein